MDERRIVPSVDLLLNTSARNYDITLAVSGPPEKTVTTMTSNPSLPEPDIMALLVTGRTLDEMRGEEFEVAREQVFLYLAGRAGCWLGRGWERATGLSEVRIEPNLIANEANPGARLTVGQNVTDQVKLIYSTDLANSDNRIWVAEYDVTKRFQSRGVRQSDNSYRFDFRHDVQFGGQPPPSRLPRHRPTVAGVEVTSDTSFDQAEVRSRFRVKRAMPMISLPCDERQNASRRSTPSRDTSSRVFAWRGHRRGRRPVQLHVVRGPLVDLMFQGATPPANVRDDVRAWAAASSIPSGRATPVEALRAWLMGTGHLQANVDYRIEPTTATITAAWCSKSSPDRAVGAGAAGFRGGPGIIPMSSTESFISRASSASSSPIRRWSPDCWSATTASRDISRPSWTNRVTNTTALARASF